VRGHFVVGETPPEAREGPIFRCGLDGLGLAPEPLVVGSIGDDRVRLEAALVDRDDLASMHDADVVGGDPHLDGVADEVVRHAVADGADVDVGIVGDASSKPLRACDEGPLWKGAKGLSLVALEACPRTLVGGAVDALVGRRPPRFEVVSVITKTRTPTVKSLAA
jgi:hypothetical protein